MRCLANDEYQREAFNSTNTSEDEEYKDRSEAEELCTYRILSD